MKRDDILLILIPTFLLVIAWIIFGVYQNTVTSTISQTLARDINPITPRFDTVELTQLKTRTSIIPQYTPDIINKQTLPSSQPTTQPSVSSSSATLQASPKGSIGQ